MQEKEVILGRDGKPMYEVIENQHQRDTFMFVPVFGGMPLKRVGFLSPVPPRYLGNPEYIHDSRPICWPIRHPYFLVRQSADANMLMVYIEHEDDVKTFWPEATEITVFEEGVMKYAFNANFQKPSWLDEVQSVDFVVKPPRIGAFRIVNKETEESLIGYSDDLDYAVQLHCHQLLYGVHADKAFQDNFRDLDQLEIIYNITKDLASAEHLAGQIRDFESSGEDEEGIDFTTTISN